MARARSAGGRGAGLPAGAALLGLLLLCPACERAPREAPAPDGGDQPAPRRGGEVVIATSAEPQELNCIRAGDTPSVRLCQLIADTLVDHDRDLRIVPRLASSFEASEDGRVLTFRIRKGVHWHDGQPLTSRDVLYTVERIRDPRSAIRGNLPALFDGLKEIHAPDDHTVVATYEEPFALAWEAWARAFIVPAHLPFAGGEETPLSRSPVGTGPFRFHRWEPGEQVVLVANDDYFGGRPWIDRLVYRVVPDRHALVVGLRTRDIDLVGLSPTEAPEDDAGLPFRIVHYPAPMLDFILWNTRAEPGLFVDPRVRRAISMALDRPGYIEHVTGGLDLPSVSSFHPAVWAHDPSLEPLPHDPAGAARLLAEAGWRDRDGDGILDTPVGPAAFTLLFYSGLPLQEKIASLLREALADLGIEVRLRGLDWPTLREKVYGRSFQAAVYRWNLDVDPDPYDFFHSSQSEQGQNLGGYSNPEVDRLAEEGRRLLDPGRRASLYHRVERILREEQPYTFISHPTAAAGVSRRLRGVEVGPRGFWGWYPAALRWYVPDEPRTGPAAPAAERGGGGP